MGEVSEISPSLSEYATDGDLAAVALFTDYPEALLRFASLSCVVFMLIGIPGNLITIIALARCKKVSSFKVLIFNLFSLKLGHIHVHVFTCTHSSNIKYFH